MQHFCPQCGDRFPAGRECPTHEAPMRPVGEGDDWAGQILDEKFLLLQRLGSGRFGVVYECLHLRARTRLAVKILRDDSLNDARIRDGFLKEARATMTLASEHVVTVRDIDEDPHGRLYIVMDLIAGGTLTAWLHAHATRPGRPIDRSLAVRFGRQIAGALRDAHARGIVHRDLKPDNIMIEYEEDGSPALRVVDFSTAWRERADSGDTTEIVGVVIGTPAWMSPEQCMAKPIDARSDLYALGVILYEMLTGERPIQAETGQAFLVAHVTHTPRPLRQVVPDLAPDLSALVMSLLAKDRADRPASASDVIAALDGLRNEVATVPPVAVLLGTEDTLSAGEIPDSILPASKRPAWPSVLASGLLVAGVAAIAVYAAPWLIDLPVPSPRGATATTTEAPRPEPVRPPPSRAVEPAAPFMDATPARPARIEPIESIETVETVETVEPVERAEASEERRLRGAPSSPAPRPVVMKRPRSPPEARSAALARKTPEPISTEHGTPEPQPPAPEPPEKRPLERDPEVSPKKPKPPAGRVEERARDAFDELDEL